MPAHAEYPRIALLSTWDRKGGASRAAFRLHRALRDAGADSSMIVQAKESTDPHVLPVTYRWISDPDTLRRRLTYVPLRVYRGRNRERVFSAQWAPGAAGAVVERLAPDVLNLHWVCSGFLSVEDIGRLRQPVVWTLHDMWPFTGGCHYSGDCRRFEQQCGACPELGSKRSLDFSRWVFRRKAAAWRRPVHAVSPSRWLADLARRSSLFQTAKVHVIPNSVDTELFAPRDRAAARAALGLPAGKKVVFFGAASALDDPRKGFPLLAAALAALPEEERRDLVLVIAGSEARALDLPVATDFRGVVGDDRQLALLYAAADVFVAPSREENLSSMVLEALASGTPCAAFDVGGMPDMIRHGETGYLARPFEPADFAQGIRELLTGGADLGAARAAACRRHALTEYTMRRQAERYLAVYAEALQDSGKAGRSVPS